MSDDEALAKVRARMAEWQAYVAQPRSTDHSLDCQEPDIPEDSFGARPTGEASGVRSENYPSVLQRIDVDSTQLLPARLSHQVEIPIYLSDFPVTPLEFGQHGHWRSRAVISRAACFDAADEATEGQATEVDAPRQFEHEQTRRLTEAIAREQELIAREQLLRAATLRSSAQTWRSPRVETYADHGYLDRHREWERRDWTQLILWIGVLIGCILSLLMVFFFY